MAQPNLIPDPDKTEAEGYGIVQAFDPQTGDKKWEYKMTDITWAGVLTTASDLLFSGGREGYFYALDAKNGNLLWTGRGQINSGPMTYMVEQSPICCCGGGQCVVCIRAAAIADAVPADRLYGIFFEVFSSRRGHPCCCP